MPGESACGDRGIVSVFDDGALAAVVDGLGHGPEAESAALAACGELQACPSLPIESLMRACHRTLAGTRGAALTLARISVAGSSVEWLSVGNVEGVILSGDGGGRSRGRSVLRGGIVGHQLPLLRVATYPLEVGDVLLLATDGVQNPSGVGLSLASAAQSLAQAILARGRLPTDDALVLVVRFLGGPDAV
jgi:serine phosphatase RsbU (regulator of sigma subunit)